MYTRVRWLSNRKALFWTPSFSPTHPPTHLLQTAFDIDAKMIVVLTETGTTPRLIAKYRPSMPILALTAIPETARVVQGVVKNSYCVVIGSMIGTESILFRVR